MFQTNKSTSFELLDAIRYRELNDYDTTILLMEYTHNYNLELLKKLFNDIDFYLFTKKEDKIAEYSNEEIEEELNEKLEKGSQIVYIEVPDLSGKNQKKSKIVDLEAMLFPFEFLYIREFQLKVYKKIQELEKGSISIPEGIEFKINQTELIELVKALIENKNIKGTQKDIINFFATIFDTKINNQDKIINDLKGRDKGTKFLDKLRTSLFNYLAK